MSTPLRIVIPKGTYHVTARGNSKEPIYHDAVERQMFSDSSSAPPASIGGWCSPTA